MTPHQAAHLTHLSGQTSAAPSFGVMWHAHNLAAEAVCDAGEYAMKKRQRGERRARQAPYQPIILPGVAFLARYYPRQAWASLPGPWPVKVLEALIMAALLYLAQFIPGQFDDYAVFAMPRFFRWVARQGGKTHRKAEAQ